MGVTLVCHKVAEHIKEIQVSLLLLLQCVGLFINVEFPNFLGDIITRIFFNNLSLSLSLKKKKRKHFTLHASLLPLPSFHLEDFLGRNDCGNSWKTTATAIQKALLSQHVHRHTDTTHCFPLRQKAFAVMQPYLQRKLPEGF